MTRQEEFHLIVKYGIAAAEASKELFYERWPAGSEPTDPEEFRVFMLAAAKKHFGIEDE